MIRAFIAIELDEATRTLLADTQSRLLSQFRAAGLQSAVRPVAVKQMHLTLCFLGNIEESYVNPIAESLQQIGTQWQSQSTGLRLALEELGSFPNLKRPRVLWCGIGGDTEKLIDLQRLVLQAVTTWCDQVDDKPFHPHLTLFRITTQDQAQKRRIGEIVRAATVETGGVWPIAEMKFIQSELSPDGPRYTALATIPLGA